MVAGLLGLHHTAIIAVPEGVQLLQRVEAPDHVLDRDRLAVVPLRLRVQAKARRGKVGGIADRFGDERVLGGGLVERLVHQRVVEKPAVKVQACRRRAAHHEGVETVIGTDRRLVQRAALRRVWIDIIVVREVRRVFRGTDERGGFTPFAHRCGFCRRGCGGRSLVRRSIRRRRRRCRGHAGILCHRPSGRQGQDRCHHDGRKAGQAGGERQDRQGRNSGLWRRSDGSGPHGRNAGRSAAAKAFGRPDARLRRSHADELRRPLWPWFDGLSPDENVRRKSGLQDRRRVRCGCRCPQPSCGEGPGIAAGAFERFARSRQARNVRPRPYFVGWPSSPNVFR